MAIRTILQYPDPRLRLKAKPVTKFDDDLRHLVADMIETMIASNGMGLAATQINVHQQVIVMSLTKENQDTFAIINPKIVSASGEEINDEYCLSVFEKGVPVKRAKHIHLVYYNEIGKEVHQEASDLAARCFQHEMDHLQGIVTVDYLSALKRKLYDRKLKRLLNNEKTPSA